jgi:hypothetical protein
MNIIGKKYRNLVTGNTYKCTGHDGNLLTLQGIGKIKVTFQIPWLLVLSNYQEIGYQVNKQMMQAIKGLLLSEDNTGCSDDLTVVSMQAIEKLRKEYEKEKRGLHDKG